jgi:YHS domain-containing protein
MAKKTCIVCGEEIKKEKSCTEHEGKHYCFCSEDCHDEFESNPEEYLEKEEKEEKEEEDWN